MAPSWDEYVDERGGLLLAYESKDVDAFYADGQYGPQLTIDAYLTHPEDYPRISEGVIHNWYNLPKGWRVADNGARVEAVGWTANNGNVQEPPTKFRNDSPIGRLVAQMKVVDPDGATLANGTPYTADYWKKSLAGRTLWGPVNVTKRAETDGVWQEVAGGKDISMPVEISGQVGTNGQAPAGFDLASLQLSPEIMAGLSAAASASKSYSDFLPKAVSVPGLPSTPAWGQISNTETGPRILKALQPF